jgi:hypothetical protein
MSIWRRRRDHPVGSGGPANAELREDFGLELREDGSVELRE